MDVPTRLPNNPVLPQSIEESVRSLQDRSYIDKFKLCVYKHNEIEALSHTNEGLIRIYYIYINISATLSSITTLLRLITSNKQ